MKIVIKKLKVGYAVINEPGEVYAFSYFESVCRKIRELFGVVPRESHKKKVAVEPVVPISTSVQEPKKSDITNSDVLIPEFEWDKSKEKHYQKIDFFEGDDGKVTIFYINVRIFTTKEKILSIPYPIPYRYPVLQIFSGNKLTAIRTYRKYLEEAKLGKNKTDELNKYLIKSTQDRIKEISERKTASIPFISMEKAIELKHNREHQINKNR